MSETEKMYENVGIYPDCRARECGLDYCANSSGCGYAVYPDFTAEKQIELIKLIANSKGYPDYEYFGKLFDDYIQLLEFDEALARLVNSIWQDLTSTEQEEIRKILKG